ncbi:MAG: LLM class flavin-dependent oxidoreductase [Chloroflexi bacterium]|nr:LLM class flavin-dependent oxidoreductase [Chloroflexota bacterium]
MKFSNFLFPESKTPETDFQVVTDALKEAELSEELGFDGIWVGEHHFDGACSYADPISFAAAVVARTKRVTVGFAAIQASLHHPVRLAEQIALLDNLSEGRIIVGTARGTAFNFYEYRGYGVAFEEAQGRLLELEEILVKAWTTEGLKHKGEFWDIEIPVLRPRVYQDPHPPIIRAVATEGSTIEMARQGRPIMLVIHPDDVTRDLFDKYRATMAQSGFDDEAVERSMSNCWIWRNIVVADTDAEAERIGVDAYYGSREHIGTTRKRLNTSQEQESLSTEMANPRHTLEHGLIFGSPETVCQRIREIETMGIGGLIIHFRLGPMSWEDNERSLRLFSEKVMPEFRTPAKV